MSVRDSLRSTLSRLSTASLPSDYLQPDILCPLAEERGLYLTDENCLNCLIKFNIPGVSHSRKQYCNFCYRGMCVNCMNRNHYYHQELNENKPICQQCVHKVTILSLDFQNELQKKRLERLELRKEIDLAISQRHQYAKERMDSEQNLKEIKKSLGVDLEESLRNIEALKVALERNKEKADSLRRDIKAKKHYLKELAQEESAKSETNALMKAKYQQERVEKEVISEGLFDINHKISALKGMINEEGDAEEVISENIENLILSITEIQGKYEDVTEKIHQLREIESSVVEEIGKNQEKIDELNKKLDYLKKPSDQQDLSQAELDTLNKLKKQIKDLDEIIKLKEERKTRHYSIYRKDPSHAKIPFTSLEEVPQRKSEPARSLDQEDAQGFHKEACCRSCIIN